MMSSTLRGHDAVCDAFDDEHSPLIRGHHLIRSTRREQRHRYRFPGIARQLFHTQFFDLCHAATVPARVFSLRHHQPIE